MPVSVKTVRILMVLISGCGVYLLVRDATEDTGHLPLTPQPLVTPPAEDRSSKRRRRGCRRWLGSPCLNSWHNWRSRPVSDV